MFSLETESRTRPANLQKTNYQRKSLNSIYTYTEEYVRRISVVRFLCGC